MEKEAPIGKIYPEQYVRPFKTLRQEFELVRKLGTPHFDNPPRIGNIKITDKCQMNCNYCDANKNKGKEMTTGQVFKVLDNFSQAKIEFLDINGGEPTIRGDLPEIISHAKDLGMMPFLNTNGGANKGYQYWYDLAEAGLFGATFSYDAIGQKNDPKVIHLASFLTSKLHIYGGIRMVISKDNLDKVYETGENCILNNVFFTAVPAFDFGGETSASSKDFNALDYNGRKKLAKTLSALSKLRGPINLLRFQKNYIKEIMDSPNTNSWHCKHPANYWTAVDAQGKARICGDRALSKTYLLTEENNPIKTKEFRQDVERESKNCPGCSWYCNWEGNKKQLERGLEQARLVWTIAQLT